VRNNLFSSIAPTYNDAPTIFIGYSADNIIEKNDFGDTPICHVACGWGWGLAPLAPTPSNLMAGNIVRDNYCHGGRRIIAGTSAAYMTDLGCLYFVGDIESASVEGNYVVTATGDNGGLYCDLGCNGVVATGNAFNAALAGWAFLIAVSPVAHDNVLTGNYWSGVDINVGYDGSNTVSGNTNSIAGAAAQAIILAAGRT
jgi:hypothetical protein